MASESFRLQSTKNSEREEKDTGTFLLSLFCSLGYIQNEDIVEYGTARGKVLRSFFDLREGGYVFLEARGLTIKAVWISHIDYVRAIKKGCDCDLYPSDLNVPNEIRDGLESLETKTIHIDALECRTWET